MSDVELLRIETGLRSVYSHLDPLTAPERTVTVTVFPCLPWIVRYKQRRVSGVLGRHGYQLVGGDLPPLFYRDVRRRATRTTARSRTSPRRRR